MDTLYIDKTGTLTRGSARLEGALGSDGTESDEVLRLAAVNAALHGGLVNPLDDAIVAAGGGLVEGWTKTAEVPCDFSRRRMSVAATGPGGERLPITKGALASVLEACDGYAGAAGAIERLSAWGGYGYRVLGLAARTPAAEETITRTSERGLEFQGSCCFSAPRRTTRQRRSKHRRNSAST